MVQKPSTYPSLAVANFFVQQSAKTGTSLTPMKLLKLVYIAHGWSLALFDKPLVSEVVQAWDYGPVIPEVYYAFRHYRARQITDMARERVGDKMRAPVIDEADRSAKALLEKVWLNYGNCDALYLSTITHQPNTPWSRTWESHGKNATIPQDAIALHYKELANVRRPVSEPA